jgi:hypothetical protein
MVVAERYQQLWTRLHELREALLELRITVGEDRPQGEATMLVERLGDDVDDGLAAVEEALEAVRGAMRDPDGVRAGGLALSTAHERLTRAADGYWQGLGSFERRRQLHSLGRRRGGEWGAWVRSVEDSHAGFPARLTAVSDELRRAWLELVERAASGTISLTASSIGQQISVPGAQRSRAHAREDG